jgi:hypothetical protein
VSSSLIIIILIIIIIIIIIIMATPYSRVLFEKPVLLQLVAKFPALYVARMYITVFQVRTQNFPLGLGGGADPEAMYNLFDF